MGAAEEQAAVQYSSDPCRNSQATCSSPSSASLPCPNVAAVVDRAATDDVRIALYRVDVAEMQRKFACTKTMKTSVVVVVDDESALRFF